MWPELNKSWTQTFSLKFLQLKSEEKPPFQMKRRYIFSTLWGIRTPDLLVRSCAPSVFLVFSRAVSWWYSWFLVFFLHFFATSNYSAKRHETTASWTKVAREKHQFSLYSDLTFRKKWGARKGSLMQAPDLHRICLPAWTDSHRHTVTLAAFSFLNHAAGNKPPDRIWTDATIAGRSPSWTTQRLISDYHKPACFSSANLI